MSEQQLEDADPYREDVEYVVSQYEYATDSNLCGRLGVMARRIARAGIAHGHALATTPARNTSQIGEG